MFILTGPVKGTSFFETYNSNSSGTDIALGGQAQKRGFVRVDIHQQIGAYASRGRVRQGGRQIGQIGAWTVLLSCARQRWAPRGKGAPSPLLDGDRFCEIAGFVDVATTFDGDVVTEQLHRNGCDDG